MASRVFTNNFPTKQVHFLTTGSMMRLPTPSMMKTLSSYLPSRAHRSIVNLQTHSRNFCCVHQCSMLQHVQEQQMNNIGEQNSHNRLFTTDSSKPPINSGPPWKVLFLGTDEFAMQHLKALNQNRFVFLS